MKKIFTLIFVLCSLFSHSQTVVISQVYGAGGNTGAVYNADYVELHNNSGLPVSLAGYSIQYSSATGTAWSGVSALPAATIPAGGYYLIQMANAGTNGIALPTPDNLASPTISMAAGAGKVALVNGITALAAGCPTAGSYIDLVGYGTTANCFEGAAPTATLSATLAAFRGNNGCTETNNNGADFSALAPLPRNSASPVFNCGAVAPSLTVTGTIADFGNIVVGSFSTSQSYALTGADLTGAPGNITITAPSADFQVSNDNLAWGSSTTIAYTSATLASTNVWVRFSPQSVGLKTGDVTNVGGGASVNVPVSGTGVVPATPTLTASALTAFGNVCVNTTVGPNSFDINGTSLTTADITVGPLTGFSFSTSSGGTYTPSLTLTQPGGAFTQTVYVNFTPTANTSYNGNIDIAGGGAPTVSVAASGAGADNPPSLTTGAASAITTTTATLSGTITDNGCTAVSAYGIEYSTTSGFPNGSGTPVTSTNLSAGGYSSDLTGLVPSTTYYYHAYATNAGGTGYGTEQSFTTASPVLTATTLEAFGSICINTVAPVQSFTVSSTGLNSTNVNVGPLAGYTFSTTATGTYTASLSLTQPGGPYNQVIYVKFSPAAIQSYNGNIPVSGGGASTVNIAVTGGGNNSAPIVLTGSADLLSPNEVNLNGTISSNGCTSVIAYGIEYSGIDGFTPGYGTKLRKLDIPQTDYFVNLNNLVRGTTYYYRAYATNDGGIAYGDQQSFTLGTLPAGLTIYGSPVPRNGSLHYSVDLVKPGHFQTRIINSLGQVVFQREVITQVDFINDYFTLPVNIGPGRYFLEVSNNYGNIKKSFMIF